MELAFIREFVTLAEIRKFSAAAQQLHISQSTLSRHIQTLETELGCTLFTRTTRDVELSACGALYLPYAKKIAHIAGAADARLREYRRQQRQTLSYSGRNASPFSRYRSYTPKPNSRPNA